MKHVILAGISVAALTLGGCSMFQHGSASNQGSATSPSSQSASSGSSATKPQAAQSMSADEVRQIAKLYLDKLRRQMERQGKTVEVTEAAVNLLTEMGFNTAYGARFLKRHIDEKVKSNDFDDLFDRKI